MDYLLDKDHWASMVRDFKDSEREYNMSAYKSGLLAEDILATVRGLLTSQVQLFKEHRGEKYEMMVKKLNSMYDEGAVRRILDDDEFWEATFRIR
jgi:hypothetical protein